MLIVPLTCPTCGADGRHLDGSLFALCAHCGGVIARHRDAIAGAVQAVRRAYVGFIAPSARDARLAELGAELVAAHAAGDRDRFRLVAIEQLLLEIAGSPARVPPGVGPAGLAGWVRIQVAAHEIAAFEQRGFPHLGPARLEADPDGAARAHLAACQRRARELVDDPAFPVEHRGQVAAETLALDMFRVAILACAPMLSPGAIERALAVIGASEADERACPRCGGPYGRHDAAVGACPWCRTAIDVLAEHPWVAALAHVAGAALAIQRRPGERASIAVQIVLSNVMTTRRAPAMPLALAYLRQVAADLERAPLLDVIDVLRHGGDAVTGPFLRDLHAALDDWRATAPAPAPVTAATAPETIEAAWDDPWVRTQLVTWGHTRPGRDVGLAALTFALLPLALGGSITPAQGAAFMLRAGVAAPEAIAAARLRLAAATPDEAGFLARLIELILLAPSPPALGEPRS